MSADVDPREWYSPGDICGASTGGGPGVTRVEKVSEKSVTFSHGRRLVRSQISATDGTGTSYGDSRGVGFWTVYPAADRRTAKARVELKRQSLSGELSLLVSRQLTGKAGLTDANLDHAGRLLDRLRVVLRELEGLAS